MFNFIGRIISGVVGFVSNCVRIANSMYPGFGNMCYGVVRNYAMARMGMVF
jgi:hypothetical protein